MPAMNTSSTTDNVNSLKQLKNFYEAGDYKKARELLVLLKKEKNLSKKDIEMLDSISQSMATDRMSVAALAFTGAVLLFLILKFAM